MDWRVPAALSLYAFVILGVFLLLAPWTSVWEEASQVLIPAKYRAWTRSGWVRGGVSGLGALDLLVAGQVGLELLRAIRSSDKPAGRPEE